MKAPTLTRKRNQSVSINLEKSLSRYALATATIAAVAIPVAAKAQEPDTFSGPYAPASWSFSNTGGSTNGNVNTAGAPASITLTGGSAGPGAGTTNFTHAAVASGLVTFNWTYSSTDTGTYDGANFLLNGVTTLLANNATQGSGTFSIAVNAGDIFGFQVFSTDNFAGPGVLTVSNFNAPVPEGSTLALLALGAVGVVMVVRRQARSAA